MLQYFSCVLRIKNIVIIMFYTLPVFYNIFFSVLLLIT